MFDPDLLKNVSSVEKVPLKDANLFVRPLRDDDFHKGFLDLLKQLTSVGDVDESAFKKRFNDMKSCNGTYYNTVIVDKSVDKIIGAATLIVERKFIHKCANVCIVLLSTRRGFDSLFSERNYRRSHCQ